VVPMDLDRIVGSRSLGPVRKFWEKLRTRPAAVLAKALLYIFYIFLLTA
jgi:hypothetical protein